MTRRSGSSIRGEHVSHGGNKRLKRAMFASALRLPTTPTPSPGPTTNANQARANALGQAVLALAHRRIPTLHTMIRNDTLYDPQPTTKPPTAT